MKSKIRLHQPSILLVAVLVSLLFVLGADARPPLEKVKSKLSLAIDTSSTLTPAFLYGSVNASARACRANRSVGVFRLESGRRVRIDRATTKKSGKWRSDADVSPGEYVATVEGRSVGKYWCKASTSNPLILPNRPGPPV